MDSDLRAQRDASDGRRGHRSDHGALDPRWRRGVRCTSYFMTMSVYNIVETTEHRYEFRSCFFYTKMTFFAKSL